MMEAEVTWSERTKGTARLVLEMEEGAMSQGM